MLKKMNLPNKLTTLRIILVPIFVICLTLASFIYSINSEEKVRFILAIISFVIFVVAAFTDFLDGRISRKKGIVTKFGKIMDPLADKLLVSSGFIMLTGLGIIPAFITAIVVFRDFFVNALRMFGADSQKDLAAGLSGKVKTLFQMLTIVFALLSYCISPEATLFGFISNSMSFSIIGLFVNVAMSVCTVGVIIATVWSFIDYFIRFKADIDVEN